MAQIKESLMEGVSYLEMTDSDSVLINKQELAKLLEKVFKRGYATKRLSNIKFELVPGPSLFIGVAVIKDKPCD